MIEIKNIDGSTLYTAPVTNEAVFHNELMASEYIELTFYTTNIINFGIGCYIEYNSNKYTVIDAIKPEIVDGGYKYTIQFKAEWMGWGGVSFFYINDFTGKTESKWSMTGTPDLFLQIVVANILRAKNKQYAFSYDSQLTKTVDLEFDGTSVLEALSMLAEAFETEWWVDGTVIHLSKCDRGEALPLTYGDNIGVPSREGDSEYATRIYALGSTRNITQDYQSGGTTNSIIQKRLTLPIDKYPNGYKDIRENLSTDEIIEKTVIFDDIYPSSDYSISDVRIKASLDTNAIVGYDENNDPIYASFPIYFFKIKDINFTNNLIIEGQTLKGHFLSGHLQGREFELSYSETTNEYEIIVNQDGSIKIPNESLMPQDGDVIILFNIIMPQEYIASAEKRLEQELDKYIQSTILADTATYSFKTNSVSFFEHTDQIYIGRKVYLDYGHGAIQSRILSYEYTLDTPSSIDIKVGDAIQQGRIESIETESVNASSNIDIIKAYNNAAQTATNLMNKAITIAAEGIARIGNMWILDKTKDTTSDKSDPTKWLLRSIYPVVSEKAITAYYNGINNDPQPGFTGSLVDLVDVAVSGLKAGDILKYDGTHFVNVPISSIAGASSWEQISGKPEYFPTRWSEIKDAPESLPASDVYPWAKAATKPSYNWDEITDKPSVFTPASHTHVWANITDRPTKLSQFQDDVVDGNYFKLSAVRTTDLNDAPINSFFVSSNNPANSPTSYTTYAVGLTLALNNDKNFKQQLIYTADNWYYRSQGGGDWYQWHVLWSAANFNPSNKLDKSVWDEAFEIKTVNGVRVISAKLDVLGQKGISAYADSADSGSAGGSLDYELLKNALTGIITPDGYPFTISSKFLGAIDKSYITGQIGDLYADSVHTHKWSDITDRPTSLPANGGNADSAIKLNNSQEFDFSTSALSYLNLYGPAGSGVLVNDCPTNDWWHILRCLRADVNGYYTDIAVPMGGNALYWKRVWNGTLQNNGWVKIWDSVNLTKLSQLQDDVVSGNYFKLSANRVSNLNDTPINSFFVSALGPSYSPVSYASFVNGFCFAADNNSSYKRQLVYADDWYGRTQNVGTWGGWYKFWHSGNLNPVTIDSDQIITGWKRFNPSTKNGVFNTTGIIDNKDTYATPLSWTAKTAGSIWNIQQESDSITLIGIQGGKAIKFLSNPSLTQVIADFFAGTATKAQQDGNGNVIASSYLRLTGGTLTGSLTTQNITANGTVTADRFSGPLSAGYTGNGGQQGPGYVGMYNFICLMMNTPVNGDSSFKNWLLCDAYAGSDAGGATAIGVSRQNMKVFAMSSNADRTAWNRTCEIYTTENANRNSVDWTARNITAAGTVTAPTFVGKLSGASSLLNINNDAGQSSVLQFMQMTTQNEANDLPSNTWHHVLKMNHGNGDTYFSRSLAFSFFDNGIYTRYRSNGTAHEWVALYGGHNANRSDVDWTARNINASETGTFKRLVINGIVIEVVNGNLRVNGNLVATGGVTSQVTA